MIDVSNSTHQPIVLGAATTICQHFTMIQIADIECSAWYHKPDECAAPLSLTYSLSAPLCVSAY